MTTPTVLRLRAVAARLGVCTRTVRRYILAGKLDAFHTPGGQWRIRGEEFDRATTTGALTPEAIRAQFKLAGRRHHDEALFEETDRLDMRVDNVGDRDNPELGRIER